MCEYLYRIFRMWWVIFLVVTVLSSSNGLDDDIQKTIDYIIQELDPNNISNYLRNLTLRPHLGGTEAEHEVAQYVADQWKQQGLDEVHMPAYDVLLSYPDTEKLNYVRIHDGTGSVFWKSQGRSPPVQAPEEFSPEVPSDFNAYSPPGNVTGDIVYANFGRKEDFEKLVTMGIDVTGKIVLAKYGELYRGNIVHFAEIYGAVGVLLYSDPQQYAQKGEDSVYADTIYLPGGAAALGSVILLDGDPSTPFYPAIESACHRPESEMSLPKIPVMPMSYNDAQQLLQRMKGETAPNDWQGNLNLTYRVGPGLQEDWRVSMEVNTHNERATTYDVIGVIKGSIEPDRYVLLGNHRDAWIFGAVDPSSGTAVMLEIARTLTKYMKETGWRPRRSILFASWGSEEYALIGSCEWGEQFAKQLTDRAIAYLNVDMAMDGNHTIRVLSAPLLYKAIEDIAKVIPNPNPDEVATGRETVYDTWIHNLPSQENPQRPEKGSIDSASDYRIFQHTLGVPSMDFRYTHSKDIYSEPLYHTLYETYFLVSELYDIGFHYHASVGHSWAGLAAYLAESEVLPFSVVDYGEYIVKGIAEYEQGFADILQQHDLSLEMFKNASISLLENAKSFEERLISSPPKDPLEVRRINDQMMQMERAFIDPQGLPGRPDMNHVLMATSASNSYATSSFPGLSDVWDEFGEISEEEKKKRVRTFKQHLAACTHALLVASKVLSQELW